MCANGAYRRALAGAASSLIRLHQGGGAMAAHLLTTTCSAGRGTRTNTSSRIFHGSGSVVGGATTTDNDGGRGRREEVERDGSTLAKLGGAMTDTALAIFFFNNVLLCYALLTIVRFPLSMLLTVHPKCFANRSPMCCANHGFIN